nr:hypothetical protein 12 [bacterium]
MNLQRRGSSQFLIELYQQAADTLAHIPHFKGSPMVLALTVGGNLQVIYRVESNWGPQVLGPWFELDGLHQDEFDLARIFDRLRLSPPDLLFDENHPDGPLWRASYIHRAPCGTEQVRCFNWEGGARVELGLAFHRALAELWKRDPMHFTNQWERRN